MSSEIRSVAAGDVPELSRFLTRSFGTRPDAVFAAPEVLSWKLFDPMGGPEFSRGLVALVDGAIVAHIGLHPISIRRAGRGADPIEVFAIHPVDWVVSREGVGLGARLLLKVHRMAGVHLGIGLTADSAAIGRRTRYEVRQRVPLCRAVFRPSHRLRNRDEPLIRRAIGASRDAVGMLRRSRPPRVPVELEAVGAFGPEAAGVVDRLTVPVVFTRRDPDLLNHVLRFPMPWFTGWMVRRAGTIRGFLLLGVVPRGSIRVGKLVDCFLDDPEDHDLWHATIRAATDELRRRGADLAESFGATPWLLDALQSGGYRASFSIPVHVRDPSGALPRGDPMHLTSIEADYSYT